MNEVTSAGVSYTLSTSGMTLAYPRGESPKSPPNALMATLAVQVQKGWVGQIVIDSEIVYQTKPKKTSHKALTAVNARVVNCLRSLFSESPGD